MAKKLEKKYFVLWRGDDDDIWEGSCYSTEREAIDAGEEYLNDNGDMLNEYYVAVVTHKIVGVAKTEKL